MSVYYDTETLSLGGGIVEADGTDMGFCPSFSMQIQIEKKINHKYYQRDGSQNIIKLPVFDKSKIISLNISGQFTCESIIYETFQKLGFMSDSTDKILSLLENDFYLPVYSLKFTSSPAIGRQIIVEFSNVFIEAPDSLNLLNTTSWHNISFNFTGLLDEFKTHPPELQLNILE